MTVLPMHAQSVAKMQPSELLLRNGTPGKLDRNIVQLKGRLLEQKSARSWPFWREARRGEPPRDAVRFAKVKSAGR